MINAGIVGLGWWGKNLVEAVQNRSDRLRFVRGACRDTAPVAAFAERQGLALSTSMTASRRWSWRHRTRCTPIRS
jgi:predicted dehydrogenase